MVDKVEIQEEDTGLDIFSEYAVDDAGVWVPLLRGKTRQPFSFTAATSRINAYRGLRSLLILHKPSAAKMYYSTRLPVLQVFFGIFIKFF